MTAKEKIREALTTIMSEGEANACDIYKNWGGWHYCRFGKNPIYIGANLEEALQHFVNIWESCLETLEKNARSK